MGWFTKRKPDPRYGGVINRFGERVPSRSDMVVIACCHSGLHDSTTRVIIDINFIIDEDGLRYWLFSCATNASHETIVTGARLSKCDMSKASEIVRDWIMDGLIPDSARRAAGMIGRKAWAEIAKMENGSDDPENKERS